MNSLTILLLIAFALGCDTFAVGLAVGTKMPGHRACFRLYFHFGLFQFFMPLLGSALGQGFIGQIQGFAPYLSAGLLFTIAAKMLKESFSEEQEEREGKDPCDPTRGWSLVALSVATSIDALGVGFSMGIQGGEVLKPALVIGVCASVMTFVGLKLGARLSEKWGRSMNQLGAAILFVIGLKFLLT